MLYCTVLYHTVINVISYYFFLLITFIHFSSSILLISSLQWVGFFGCVSYEVFGDFISIAELEHCILRNGECWQIFFHLSCRYYYKIFHCSFSLFLVDHSSVLLHLRLYHPFSHIYSLNPRPHLHPHPIPSLNTLTDMSRPKVGMFAKYVIPQTSFDFALHRKDFRLIWAINCGSYSLVPLVPIYEAHLLDAQLDAVMR